MTISKDPKNAELSCLFYFIKVSANLAIRVLNLSGSFFLTCSTQLRNAYRLSSLSRFGSTFVNKQKNFSFPDQNSLRAEPLIHAKKKEKGN